MVAPPRSYVPRRMSYVPRPSSHVLRAPTSILPLCPSFPRVPDPKSL